METTNRGDHVTLQATADAFGISINLLSSYTADVVAVQPREPKSSKLIWLSFWAEVHYNSLESAEEGG